MAEQQRNGGCDHPHLAKGEGDVDLEGIFETLREMDLAERQLRTDAPKAGGDNIACVSSLAFLKHP
ncbi:hypothetical protein NSB04_16225 [Blautia pseudococcoides]|uniref:Uncharacterized protein n=1 Tax=Blautia pseudococcoides TaxID=1796616 RepID=A0A1C7IBZ5_9FIRM|nr:hypothetical protein [Blautia pseudococcoides]ANU76444.1 hypothetical protein A4V09_12100 [Blautia pseudococcoides]MCR2021248.1 hypothetical protein [Blautia pseudococcoides]